MLKNVFNHRQEIPGTDSRSPSERKTTTEISCHSRILWRLWSQNKFFSIVPTPVLSRTSEKISMGTMWRLPVVSLFCLVMGVPGQPLEAWPADSYPVIFAKAINVLPPALQQLMSDMESVLDRRDRRSSAARDRRILEPHRRSPPGHRRNEGCRLRRGGRERPGNGSACPDRRRKIRCGVLWLASCHPSR